MVVTPGSRDFSSHMCRYAHRRYLATVTVERSQTLHRHGNAFIMLDINYGFI